jgi:hypothetical protein
MKHFIVLLLAVVFLSNSAIADKPKKEAKPAPPTSWTGYLLDKHCGQKMTAEKAPKHSKECLTEERCASSGYGIFMGGKWTAFDKKGNALAADYLKKTKKDKGFEITVNGKMSGSTIAVTDLKDKM